MALGPVQLLTIGFIEPNFTGAALKELQRLKERDIVRLVDVLLVAKDDDGNVTQIEVADVPELEKYGAVAGALVGLGAAGEEGMAVGAELGAEAMADGGERHKHVVALTCITLLCNRRGQPAG